MTVTPESYEKRFDEVLAPLSERLEEWLRKLVKDEGVSRIDRITSRAKSAESFLNKANQTVDGGTPKYNDPVNQIQDQVGARIITFYLSDVMAIEKVIDRHFRKIEEQNKVPESSWQFGYFGKHYLLLFPTDVLDDESEGESPAYFELQVKTLFQHAWAESNHDLGYKPESGKLTPEQARKLAFTSAQAWGADKEFDGLHKELLGQV